MVTSGVELGYQFSIEEFQAKELIYIVVHESDRIDTEVLAFRNLADAVEMAQKIAEEHTPPYYSKQQEIEQLYWEGVLYCLHYPIAGYVWVVVREIK